MQLILSGGGDAPDSKPLDELFISLLKSRKILYIPIAWKTGNFEECRKWFSSTFSSLGFTNFEMWTDLKNKTYEDLKTFGGIYIGGGNTFSLLNDLRVSGFDKLIKKFIESGGFVYGGSAGAIIFGKNIETASFGEDSDENFVNLKDFLGFNLIKGYSIKCHYEKNQDEEIIKFSKEKGLPIIALSERSGLYVQNDKLKIIGFESAYVFKNGEKTEFELGSKIK